MKEETEKKEKRKVNFPKKGKSYYRQKLWKIFAEYIKLRDSDEKGYCKCISCGKEMFWKQAQAGHFISRSLSNQLYFDPINVNPQCYECNMIKGGNLKGYSNGLEKKYGKGTVKDLRKRAKQIKVFYISELKSIISFYTEEVKKLKQKKKL